MHSREGAHAAGGVADVPHFDVGGGDGEHQACVAAVLHGHYVVGMALQCDNLLASHQVPHLTSSVCKGNKVDELMEININK